MQGTIYRYLADDHERLDAWLDRAMAKPDNIDMDAYGEFRRGLLRHIGMEEKVLLPEARRIRGGIALAGAAKLRLDHGALTALLVPSPTVALVAAIRAILRAHNPVEEDAGGIYEQCENLARGEAAAILRRLQDYPEVKPGSGASEPEEVSHGRRKRQVRRDHATGREGQGRHLLRRARPRVARKTAEPAQGGAVGDFTDLP